MKTAIFGQFDNFRSGVFWPKWSKSTSTDQDLWFEPITKSLRRSVQKFSPDQAQVLENRYFGLFWPIWQLPVGWFWSKWSKGTSTDQDLSSEPITKSLWPSVQKCWPVQAQVLKDRYFWLFWQIWQLPVGCFWPKWPKGTSTDQDLSFEPITKSLWPSVQKF